MHNLQKRRKDIKYATRINKFFYDIFFHFYSTLVSFPSFDDTPWRPSCNPQSAGLQPLGPQGLRVCGGGVYIYASDEINIKSQKTKHSVIGEYFLDPWFTKSYSSSVYSIHIFIMYSILTYIFFVANKHILKTKKRTGRKWRWMNCKKICLK